ncbi:MAG TPA: hypothetical protein VGL99_04095 [Chloroflexota bacterium]
MSVCIVIGVSAQQNNIPPPDPNCAPLGGVHVNGQRFPTSIEPEFSIWCYPQPAAIPPTRSNGSNEWVDTFTNNAPSILQFNDHDMAYRVFDVFYGSQGSFARGYFVNVDHWMIDLADVSSYRLSGGILVSPDRQFSFENGKLVVEADAAAGSDGMGGANRFYEIDISPATEPTGFGVDALYGYGSFGGIGAVGCRLERNDQGGNFVCAMYDNSGRATDGRCTLPQPCPGPFDQPGRLWETQGVGTSVTASSVVGGYPQWQIPGTNLRLSDVWRTCADNELDLHCRDRFRMEVTKDSIHLFVNGYPAMLIDGLFAQNPAGGWDNRIPDFWFQGGVRPYFTSWINGGQHTPTRWHWDRLAVNPHDGAGNLAAPSASPSFCLGLPNNTCPDPGAGGGGSATSTPTSTPRPAATSTPTPTQTRASSTPTATPRSNPTSPPTGTPRSNPTATSTPIPGSSRPVGNAQTLTFDDLASPNRPLNGQYPTGVVDWGSGKWYLSRPYGQFRTNSIGFNGAGPTSAAFSFVAPRRLVRLDAFNGGRDATTITVSCQGQPTVRQTLAANRLTTIETGWQNACSPVTVGSSNGWQTNFDNLVVDRARRTIDFDSLDNNRGRPLNGQYPDGVIDWGRNGWFLSGPFGAVRTNSIGFNGPAFTSQGFGFVSPRIVVSVDAYNGGTGQSVVTLSCSGQKTASFNLAPGAMSTLVTDWTAPCSTVTVTSSNGWQTNFDTLVIQ